MKNTHCYYCGTETTMVTRKGNGFHLFECDKCYYNKKIKKAKI